jgi:hypothetical protein
LSVKPYLISIPTLQLKAVSPSKVIEVAEAYGYRFNLVGGSIFLKSSIKPSYCVHLPTELST